MIKPKLELSPVFIQIHDHVILTISNRCNYPMCVAEKNICVYEILTKSGFEESFYLEIYF